MTLTAETIADRRRLGRSVTRWRVAAILAAATAIVSIGFMALPPNGLSGFSDHIARVRIDGLILGRRKKIDLIRRLAEADRVKAVLVAINSPGGTTAGSEALYEEIRRLSSEKPVVSVLESQATSGGYIAAIAGDYIVARSNTLTGSIGVVFQWPQMEELLRKIGVRIHEVKSDPLKATPSPFADPPAEAMAVMRDIISESHQWFLNLVAKRRKLEKSEARTLGDGRVYTGRQALEAKLIDEIGGEDAAVSWLENAKKIPGELEVKDWAPPGLFDNLSWLGASVRRMGRSFGLALAEGVFEGAEKTFASERLELDGLISVWQPEN